MTAEHQTTTYLVECFWPGISPATLAETETRLAAAAATQRRRGGCVRYLGSIFVPADESVFCLFDGLETDVRTVSERAGIPFGRVLEAVRGGL